MIPELSVAGPEVSQIFINMPSWQRDSRAVKCARAPIEPLSRASLRVMYLEWLVADGLPFRLIVSLSFQAFLIFVNLIANGMLFKSDTTIHTDLRRVVSLRRPDIVRALALARSKIHLVIDI